MGDPSVSCGQCRIPLSEDRELDPALRTPCPNCGSKTRLFSVEAVATFPVGWLSSVEAVAKLPVDWASKVNLVKSPSVLLQAVVIKGDEILDGALISAITPAWFEIVKLIERDPQAIFKISPRQWEEIIAGTYKRAGFDEIILTPRSGDLGRDVIATKKGWGCVRFIDQVKTYKPGHFVTAEEVRALGFVLMSDQNAMKGFVTTTSDFAPKITEDPLIKPHLPYRIELINGEKLVKRLSDLCKSEL